MPSGKIIRHVENTDLPYYYNRGGKLFARRQEKAKIRKNEKRR